MRNTAVVVFMTAPNGRESKRLATVLVAERLAACVNVLGGVTSVYRWKAKIEEASEHLLLAKTTRARLPAFIRRVKSLHSYTVPEIIALPVLAGSAPYLSWIKKQTNVKG